MMNYFFIYTVDKFYLEVLNY